jgi:UDP-glucuronate decarboxylase
MRILIAGAAGFLGSHLCDRLIGQGHDVVAVDNLLTGSLDNIRHLEGREHFSFVKHDIVEPFAGRFDRIYNLACPASPPHYQRDPIATARTSFAGTDNLLKLATACGARFFMASTSEVYGDPLEHPQRESYRGNVNPIGPRACYDEGKRIAETLTFDYHRMFRTDIKVARIFNTYGPRMDPNDGRVVSNFVVQALRGAPLTIYGNGGQTRSFCFVDDLIEGFLRLMESPDGVLGPINLGNPGEFTIRELAEIVTELAGSASAVAFHDLPIDDPKQRKPDITLAKSILNWEPRVSLRAGLAPTIEYFSKQMKKTND